MEVALITESSELQRRLEHRLPNDRSWPSSWTRASSFSLHRPECRHSEGQRWQDGRANLEMTKTSAVCRSIRFGIASLMLIHSQLPVLLRVFTFFTLFIAGRSRFKRTIVTITSTFLCKSLAFNQQHADGLENLARVIWGANLAEAYVHHTN
eukprot:508964-Amphidinium_carterae.3